MTTGALAAERGARARLLDRELSELAFVRRVLEEAENPSNPVLERLRFLGITGLLLDDFYRIRVTALREQIRARGSLDGSDPLAELRQADQASNALLAQQELCWQSLRADLSAAGISIVANHELACEEVDWLREHFEAQLAPLLEPVIVDAEQTFPFIKDGSIFLVAALAAVDAEPRMALVLLPRKAPRFVALPGGRMRFVTFESVVSMFLDSLVADRNVIDHGLARVVREGNLKLADDADDPLQLVRAAVERRDHADVIRLEVDSAMPEQLAVYLAQSLGLITRDELERFRAANEPITASEFVVADRLLGLVGTMDLLGLLKGRRTEHLRYPATPRARPAFLDEFDGDIFEAIAAKDRLLHFPYDDFDVVLKFLKQAAEDPNVISIHQTLYRTGHGSGVVKALVHAARLGTKVTAVVELAAREDERENIALANRLKKAGATVFFGPRDMKVHVKALAVVRREGGKLKGYVNFATGNFHARAARLYTDLSLFSTDPDLVADATLLFDHLTGGGLTPGDFRRIAIAPSGLRARLMRLIDAELEHAKAGRPAAIWIKVNKLSDRRLIEALYRASQGGVEIDIVVRGVCCLRPGVAGLSERIRVNSVVGRFLEHSRILCFGNGHGLPSDSAQVFLSSADWMPHKLDGRVEALVPIDDRDAMRRVQHGVMAVYLRDEAQCWRLDRDGNWLRAATGGFCAQRALMG